MVFAYYDMLSPARKEVYRQSDAIATLELPPGFDVGGRVVGIRDGLVRAHRPTVQKDAQALIDALVAGYVVPRVDVKVLAARPSDVGGELHGLYEQDEEIPVARISVWMRTAQRKQVVAFKSFLRTLVHEFLHHLDYEYFKLPETFHTQGFYKRESSLTYALMDTSPELR